MKLMDDIHQCVIEGDMHADGSTPDATTADLLTRACQARIFNGYGISFTPLLEYLMGRT